MCFVHKHMQNADFGANFEPMCEYKKSRDLATVWSDFRKLGIKRCVRLERKKSWKGASRSAAVARQSRISCRGGSNLTPPPVKIGLKGMAPKVYCNTRAWICMNEWNRIPIAWLSDAPPKARGQELLGFRWTGRICHCTRLWTEWIESQILVDICLDLRPFCWNVHLIWQYFVDSRKANAWTWLLMMYFYSHIVYAHSNREFCDNESLQNIASFSLYSRTIDMHVHYPWITRSARKAETARRPR